MSSMTVDGAKALVRELLDEQSDQWLGSTSFATILDNANKMVWRKIVDVNPAYGISTKAWTYPSGTVYQDISTVTYCGAEPYKILGIDRENYPSLVPATFTDRDINTWWAFDGRYKYILQGVRLYVVPVPAVDLAITVHWLPEVTTITSSTLGTAALLDGNAPAFSDAVAKCAAWLINSKQNGSNPVVQQLWAEAVTEIQNSAATRQADKGRKIHRTRLW